MHVKANKLKNIVETDIQVGTKVRIVNADDSIVNLIAIEKHKSSKLEMWTCVCPEAEIKPGQCLLYNCFVEDLKLGWK